MKYLCWNKTGKDSHKNTPLLTNIQILKRKLRDNYPALNTQKFRTQLLATENLQQLLGEEEALLAFFWQEEDLFRLILEKEEAHFDQLSIDAHFGSASKSIQRCCPRYRMHITSSIPPFVESAHYLYEKIFEGVDKETATQWVIFPDSLLFTLPFEALLQNRQNLELKNFKELSYLWKAWDIQYAFSPLLWIESQSHSQKIPYSYVGWAPSMEDLEMASTVRSDKQALKYNRKEVEQSSHYFPTPKKVFADFPISRDSFFQHIEKAAFIHASMHYALGCRGRHGHLIIHKSGYLRFTPV